MHSSFIQYLGRDQDTRQYGKNTEHAFDSQEATLSLCG